MRLFFVAGLLASVGLSSAAAPWDGWLTHNGRAWMIALGRHPVWGLPPAPVYQDFRRRFDDRQFPQPGAAYTIEHAYDAAGMAQNAALIFAPFAFVCCLSAAFRVDELFHRAVAVAVGLSLGAAACHTVLSQIGDSDPNAPWHYLFGGVVLSTILDFLVFPRGYFRPKDYAPPAEAVRLEALPGAFARWVARAKGRPRPQVVPELWDALAVVENHVAANRLDLGELMICRRGPFDGPSPFGEPAAPPAAPPWSAQAHWTFDFRTRAARGSGHSFVWTQYHVYEGGQVLAGAARASDR